MGGKIKSGTKLKSLYLRGFFVSILQGLSGEKKELVNMKIIKIENKLAWRLLECHALRFQIVH